MDKDFYLHGIERATFAFNFTHPTVQIYAPVQYFPFDVSAYETNKEKRKKYISIAASINFYYLDIVPGIAPGRARQGARASTSPPPTEAKERKGGSNNKEASPQDDAGRTGAEESVFLSCNTTRTPVFSCGEGACIPYDLRCNGVSDCANDADEAVRECGE